MEPRHWGCAANELRSPYSTRQATCAGEVCDTLNEFGVVWLCDKHREEREERAEGAAHT